MTAGDALPPPGSPQSRIRPFVLTSGRVAGSEAIGLETQVVASGPIAVAGLAPEMAAILALCTEPVSVAEISALVPLHFGVARILVGDLSAHGRVEVYLTDEDLSEDPDFLMRVLRGLRSL